MSKNTNTTKDIGSARSKYNKNSMVTDQNQKSVVDGTDSIQDDIPLADDETVAEITDSDLIKLNYANITGPEKLEKLQQQKARRHNSETNLKRPDSPGTMAARLHQQQQQQQPNSLDVNCDLSQEEIDENEKLVQKVLELQNTLDALSTRVQAVREENHKLMSENQVLSQYIENLVAASSVFQATPGKNGQNSQNTQQQQSELQSSRTNRTNNKDTHSNSAMAAKK